MYVAIINGTNLKYFIASITIAVLLIMAVVLGVFYLIVFNHNNSIGYKLTSFLLAALGVYFLYNRLRRKHMKL